MILDLTYEQLCILFRVINARLDSLDRRIDRFERLTSRRDFEEKLEMLYGERLYLLDLRDQMRRQLVSYHCLVDMDIKNPTIRD